MFLFSIKEELDPLHPMVKWDFCIKASLNLWLRCVTHIFMIFIEGECKLLNSKGLT